MKRTLMLCACAVALASLVDAEQLRLRLTVPPSAGGDTTAPNVTITSPTSASTYNTGTTPLTTLAGTASDAVGVVSCSWASDNGGSGSTTGTTSWSVSSIALAEDDDTVITVTCVDAASNEGTDVLTVTHTTGGGGEPEADITASSCSRSDVQTALTNATDSNKDGSTVVAVPSGSCTWSDAQVTWTAPANAVLRGAGTTGAVGGSGNTVITDSWDNSSPVLVITTNATGTFRMTGFTLQGGSVTTAKQLGIVGFTGQSKQFRLHHNTFDVETYTKHANCNPIGCGDRGMRFTGWVEGVMDNNIFHSNQAFDVWWGGIDAGGDGDTSWANATEFGSDNFLVAEDNIFNAINQFGAANDCQQGGKWVVRFSTLNGASVQTHPTGGAGRARGCRATEFYMNTLTKAFDPSVNFNAFWLSSGGSLVWGNNAATGYTNFITLHSMRRDNSTYTQTATPNGWGFCGTSQTGTGSNWDGNSPASTGYPCIDQPGRGVGDLLSGAFPNAENTETSSISWPNQALEPVREWLNVWASDGGCGGCLIISVYEGDVMFVDQDYYFYAGSVQTSSSSPFDGTSGIGVGTIANRPTTCTTGVAYWATDEGEWNSTNGATPDGKMYVCTATNTWTARYGDAGNTTGLPLAYPHPLRGGS